MPEALRCSASKSTARKLSLLSFMVCIRRALSLMSCPYALGPVLSSGEEHSRYATSLGLKPFEKALWTLAHAHNPSLSSLSKLPQYLCGITPKTLPKSTNTTSHDALEPVLLIRVNHSPKALARRSPRNEGPEPLTRGAGVLVEYEPGEQEAASERLLGRQHQAVGLDAPAVAAHLWGAHLLCLRRHVVPPVPRFLAL